MSKHLQRDLEILERDVLMQSSVVEEMIRTASRALREGSLDAVQEVLTAEPTVNDREVRIEDECLKILALHQPVAVDLRRVATVLKVNSDLERIADLAVNLAQRARALRDHPAFRLPPAVDKMATIAIKMVRDALDALVDLDADAARRVREQDDEVDEFNRRMHAQMAEAMQNNPSTVDTSLHALSAARHVERIADHATNIAEDVIYLVEGEIARHRPDDGDEVNPTTPNPTTANPGKPDPAQPDAARTEPRP